jgi:hypothetical protein
VKVIKKHKNQKHKKRLHIFFLNASCFRTHTYGWFCNAYDVLCNGHILYNDLFPCISNSDNILVMLSFGGLS